MADTTKVHSWMPRFPGVVCRNCGVDAQDVEASTMKVECPLCGAATGEPCTTKPKQPEDSPRPTPPHAARQRAALRELVLEPCGGGEP